MKGPIHIVSMGAVTAVGACSAVSAASVRAGGSQLRLVTTSSDLEGHVARVDWLDPEANRLERMQQLLRAALEECAVSFEARLGREPRAIPLLVAHPADVNLASLARAGDAFSRMSWSSVQSAGSGHAAGLDVLGRISEVLHAGAVDFVCLAGVDVQTDDATLEALAANDRFFAPGHPWGFVPGEGAGALMFATEAVCKRAKLPALARIHGVGTERETAPAQALPNTGRALSVACHAALDTLPQGERAGEVYCDLNGERSRSDEWGFTAPRVSHRCFDAGEPIIPAHNWGDVGSATGPLLIQLAVSDFARGFARARTALVWAASDTGTRAAATVESLDPAPNTIAIPPARSQLPIAAAAHDEKLIEVFFAESSFLFELRDQCLSRVEQDPAPEHAAAAVGAVEGRLEAQLDGVLMAGDAAHGSRDRAAAEPGEVYTSVRALLAQRSTAGLLAYLDARSLDSATTYGAASSAFAHAAPHATVESISTLLARGGRLAGLGLQLAADSGKGADIRWPIYARLGVDVLGAAFPRALQWLAQNVDAENLLQPWLTSLDDSMQLAAAWSYLTLDPDRARRYLWAERTRPGFALPLATICRPTEHASLEQQFAAIDDDARACRALAALGTPATIPLLFARFERAHKDAAKALHRVAGVALFEERIDERITRDEELTHIELMARRNGNASVGVDRIGVRGFSRDAQAWKQACEAYASADRQARFVLGQARSTASLAQLLEHPLLTPSAHAAAAAELEIAAATQLGLPADPRAFDRQRAVAQLRARLS